MPKALDRSTATRDARPSLRDLQRQDTRRRLLKTARKQFRARGVESVSMEDIAIATGVSRATVYLHFSGKAPLLEALLEEDWSSQILLFEHLQTIDFAEQEALQAWISRVAEGMRKARDSFAIHRAALGQNPELTVRHHRHRQRLAEIIIAAADRGRSPGSQEVEREVEAELIAAEIEYFATAAALGWSEAQASAGTALLTRRLQDFARD